MDLIFAYYKLSILLMYPVVIGPGAEKFKEKGRRNRLKDLILLFLISILLEIHSLESALSSQ